MTIREKKKNKNKKMASSKSKFSESLSTQKLGLSMDISKHPFVKRTAEGFMKIGTVAAARAATEDAFKAARKGNVSCKKTKQSLKKMCKEGAYWGTVAGVYVGMECAAEKVRGTKDWKNAVVGGALTGALASAACKEDKDKIVSNAIAGGAIAAAAQFLNYLA